MKGVTRGGVLLVRLIGMDDADKICAASYERVPGCFIGYEGNWMNWQSGGARALPGFFMGETILILLFIYEKTIIRRNAFLRVIQNMNCVFIIKKRPIICAFYAT